jgi:3-polyprenyl-4-hydroxybenzoate decarboxylase
MFAIGSRWQPHPASKILERAFGLQTDPSQVKRNRTSKIVIDATRQLPGEGGRDDFPMSNREHLRQGAPDAFAEVERLLVPDLFEWDEV